MNIKKLAIAACAASLAMSAKADAYAYDFIATLKTTVAAKGSIKAGVLTCLDESETMIYRKQGTVKIQGLVWGCDCTSISSPSQYSGPSEDGYAFWDVTSKSYISDAAFEWFVLNRINNTAKNAEGAWTFESECYHLMGGGFGAVKQLKSEDGDQWYLTQLAGNFGGAKCAPGMTYKTGKHIECTFCSSGEEEEEVTDLAIGWPLCDCGEDGIRYALGQEGGDLRELTKELNAAFSGRGGGKPFFVQGTLRGNVREIANFLQKNTGAQPVS